MARDLANRIQHISLFMNRLIYHESVIMLVFDKYDDSILPWLIFATPLPSRLRHTDTGHFIALYRDIIGSYLPLLLSHTAHSISLCHDNIRYKAMHCDIKGLYKRCLNTVLANISHRRHVAAESWVISLYK